MTHYTNTLFLYSRVRVSAHMHMKQGDSMHRPRVGVQGGGARQN
jgi:hypothetical protein